MDNPSDSTLRTSATLLERLKDPADHSAWRRFHDAYAQLMLAVARRAGLGEAQAQDAVQEVLVDVAQQIGAFRYDPQRGRFKNWLLTILRRRVAMHFRKRHYKNDGVETPREERLDTALAGVLPAPDAELDAAWEEEWQRHMLEKALEIVRSASQPLHFQIFHLASVGGLSATEICERLGVGATTVHWVKFRLGQRLRRAVRNLERGEPECP